MDGLGWLMGARNEVRGARCERCGVVYEREVQGARRRCEVRFAEVRDGISWM